MSESGKGPSVSLLNSLLQGLADEHAAAVQVRRGLHQHPSLSGAEGPSADLIRGAITQPVESVAQTGLATRVGPKQGPAIVVRAELDALQIRETTGVDWASTNGAMHACGHDVHAAALVALIRAAARLSLPIALLALFQPREETYPSGALDIVRSGLLVRHDVRACAAIHVHPGVQPGTFSAVAGVVNAAADEFAIEVCGNGGHGAYPYLAQDPVPVLAQIALALYEIPRRIVNPMHPSVITIGMIGAGNKDSHNVIAANGALRGTVRSTSPQDREALHVAIRSCAENIAKAHDATAITNITRGEPMLINDPGIVHCVDTLAASAGFEQGLALRSCGADDFSFYSEVAPALMAFVGVATDGVVGPQPSLHHAGFLPPDEAVGQVAAAMALAFIGCAQHVLQF